MTCDPKAAASGLQPARSSGTRWAGLSASFAIVFAVGTACKDDRSQAERVENDMKQHLAVEMDRWLAASKALQRAAPLPEGRGWDPELDAEAIEEMKAAWGQSREAYERIEGAIARVFPESDAATDARYEDYLATLGGPGDPAPFDGEGVIGMHGIERVLWADNVSEPVITFEQGLPGYRAARFPQTEAEARAFKHELAARLVSDIEVLERQFQPLSLDIAFAFRGLIDLAVEQVEKVDRASSGREESRYAGSTLRDLRANHQGCLDAYRIFAPWVLDRAGGEQVDSRVQAAFDRLLEAYSSVTGDAIPAPPAGWSSLAPKAVHLESTPFGRLYSIVLREADPQVDGSLHASLIAVADLLELPAPVTQ
jgi:iron uptake system component EfeO